MCVRILTCAMDVIITINSHLGKSPGCLLVKKMNLSFMKPVKDYVKTVADLDLCFPKCIVTSQLETPLESKPIRNTVRK